MDKLRNFRNGLLLLMISLSAGGSAAAPAQMVAEWKGEYFQKGQGAFYVKMGLKGFKASGQTKFLTGAVQVTLFNLIQKKDYVFSHKMGGIAGYPREIWKVPSGKYAVKSIAMVDAAGTRRTWGDSKTLVIIKRQTVANLGVWILSPKGADGLQVKFKMVPNSYTEDGARKDSSVAAVIDGFTGLIQEKIGGRKVLEGADDDYGGRNMRATVTFTRQIAMFYSLNLFKHNNHAKAVAAVLSVSDPVLRRCYTDRLEYNDALKGDVKFTFLLSKQTGTMSKIKHTGGTADDPKLVQCMYHELGQIQFPAPETMLGEVVYTFDVR